MKYKIWNGTDTIYTPDGKKFTPDEWRGMWPWANIPGVKMIIQDAPINGQVAMEFEQTKTVYKSSGAKIVDGMTDEEVLAAISEFEENPPITVASAEERIAAALEAQVMMAEDDVDDVAEEEPITLIAAEEEQVMADNETATVAPVANKFAMRSVSATNSIAAQSDTVEVGASVEEEEHSAGFIRARNNFQRGLWSDNIMRVAVKKGHITKVEYQEITSKFY